MTESKKPATISFNSARFLTSAARLKQCPTDQGYEVAFAGRSNAGKSSAINAITNNGKLARTSKTPGRTQLINFFSLSTPNARLVDLPGYGYAKVSLDQKDEWGRHLDEYLRNRESLQALILIMDIRKPLTDFDMMILDWARSISLATTILLTKADKFKFGAAKQVLMQVQKELKEFPNLESVILFSSTKKQGVEQARQQLSEYLLADETTDNAD